MALNTLYLTSERTSKGDEVYTPFYAVEPLIKYIPKDKIIWCPFDEEWSAFVKSLKANGNEVINTHLEQGKDFFNYEPNNYDLIVSNPPFSKKDKVLKRCYELNKPFALLLPVNSIQGKVRVNLFQKYGLELLIFDTRVDYHTRGNFKTYRKGNHFGSAYFCRNILPKELIFCNLNKYEKELQ